MAYELTTDELRRRVKAFLGYRIGKKLTADPSAGLTLMDCDGPTGSVVLRYETRPEMANVWGVVHGGIIATLVDTCMGLTCCAQCGVITPTVSMTINYARPVPLNASVEVRVRTIRCGATSGQMSAEVYLAGRQDEPLVTASGAYCTKRNDLFGGKAPWDLEQDNPL